jgi:C_GCAxxG_C_C family probable redox protein
MTRSEKAYNLFKEGYNCCQAVVLAFSDFIAAQGGPDEKTLATLCTGFGGGMGRMREVCGTVSGMTILAGFICPAALGDKAAKASNYALVQSFAARFRAANGSIICRELLGLSTPPHTDGSGAGLAGTAAEKNTGLAGTADSPVPADRTPEYYKKRPCAELCAFAASIVEDYLKENGYGISED